MKVAIFPGETLEIEVGNADGIFTFTYGEEHLTIEADMADTEGRVGVIYDENFGSVYEMAQIIAAGAAPKTDEIAVSDSVPEFLERLERGEHRHSFLSGEAGE